MRRGNNPMARDNQRDRVAAVCLTDRSGAAARLGGNIPVAAGLAIGDVAQRLPDGTPIGGSRRRQRQIKFVQLAIEIRLQLLPRAIQNGRRRSGRGTQPQSSETIAPSSSKTVMSPTGV